MNHPGLEGEVREILVADLLRPLLPPGIEVGTGKTVDHKGGVSKEIDVVIYDRAVMPALLFSPASRLGAFPVEACIYAIEVKTTSTAAELRKTASNARCVSALTYIPEWQPFGFPVERAIYG